MRETVETVGRLLEENGTAYIGMRAITDALSVGRSAAYDRVKRALFHGYLIDTAERNERGKKVALGGGLPGEELFRPTGNELVQLASDARPEHVSRSTVSNIGDLSGSPGRPVVIGDDDYVELLDRALAGGFITEQERRQRRLLHFAIRRAAAA
jgi:hypothetical protein